MLSELARKVQSNPDTQSVPLRGNILSFCSVADAAALWGYGLLLGRRQSGNMRENTQRVGRAPQLGE